MHVCLISNYYPPRVEGGAEIYVASLAEGLRERGHRVSVVTNVPGQQFDDPMVRNLNVGPSASAQALLLNDSAVSRVLHSTLHELQPDVVHVHNTHSTLGFGTYGASANFPVVVTLHDYYLFCLIGVNTRVAGTACNDRRFCHVCARRFYPAEARRMPAPINPSAVDAALALPGSARALTAIRNVGRLTHASRHVSKFLCVSDAVRNSFVLVGMDERKLTVVRNGFATPQLTSPKARDNGGILRVGFIGRLTEAKGPHILLDAHARALAAGRNIDVLVAGAGPFAEQLRAQAHALGTSARVHFFGKLDRDGVERFYDTIDVLAVPSIWPDPLPVVCCEALGRGVPLIGADIGGISEILGGGVGRLVTSGDADALASALTSLGAVELRQMRRAGVDRFLSTYARAPHLRRLEEVYEDAMSERRRTTR